MSTSKKLDGLSQREIGPTDRYVVISGPEKRTEEFPVPGEAYRHAEALMADTTVRTITIIEKRIIFHKDKDD